jgi:hypothetical protein
VNPEIIFASLITTPRKHIEGVEVKLHAFLISALDGDEWSTSRPGHFTPGETPQYPLDKRLGGPISGLDAVALLGIEPQSSSP